MRKVRILQIGLSSFPGGVENSIMNYYREIDKRKVQFDFICIESSLAYSEEIKKLGGKIFYLSNPKKNLLKYIIELLNVLKSNKYKIVHINMLSGANIVPLLICNIKKIEKVIIHSHNSNLPKGISKKFLHYIVKSFIKSRSNDYLACSKVAAKWLYLKKIAKKTIILKNAINIEQYRFNEIARNRIRKSININEENYIIGCVGRLSDEKNQKFLISVFKDVLSKLNNCFLVLVGDGAQRSDLDDLVEKLNLKQNVIFTGAKQNVYDYYSSFDLFCMPSKFEGLGIALIEAQASNLQCICSDFIPDEAIYSNGVKKISINDKDKWVEEVLNILSSNKRIDFDYKIDDYMYDIKYTVNELLDIYFKELEG